MPEPRYTSVSGDAPKPYVHPLRTPAGQVLTTVSPPDHAWHRGLWFAIKFVNGHNFWEEDEPYGSQVEVEPGRLEWRDPAGQVLLREQRRLAEVDLGAAAWALDWRSVLTAVVDVVLDRTPFTFWGGYGGLTLRGAADWEETRLLLAEGSAAERLEGVPARWCDLSGPGGGVSILDAATNPRHPVPWYASTRSPVYGEGWSNFVNAAFLFHQPMELTAGDRLRFDYRVVVHDGVWNGDRVEAAWRDWQR